MKKPLEKLLDGYRVYQYGRIRILWNNPPPTDYLFITGFKGYGLVGYITTLYLASQLDCERTGLVITRYMPEAVAVDEKGLVPPFELYQCSDSRIVVLVNHDLPHERERTEYAEAIAAWLRETRVREAVYIGGFDSRFSTGEEKYKWIATSSWTRSLEAPVMDKGLYVVGPLALLILFSDLYGIPAAAILPYAEPGRPDPRAAAVAVEVLNKLYQLSVGVEKLLEEASKIEEMMQRLAQQIEEREPSSAERAYM